METSPRCIEGRAAGVWAFSVLEERLGDDWPGRVTDAEGRPPPELLAAPWYLVAYVKLLELACALELVTRQRVPGFARVRNDFARDLREEARAHGRLLFELTVLALASGTEVILEPKLEGSDHPADARFTLAGHVIPVEARCVLLDDRAEDAAGLARRMSAYLSALGGRYSVFFSGSGSDGLIYAEEAGVFAAFEQAASEGAHFGRPVPVKHPMAGSLCALPTAMADAGTSYDFGSGQGHGWERVARIVQFKADQTLQSGARWLQIDLYDGTFQLTPWAQGSLDQRVEQLHAAIAEILEGQGHLHGVVVSCGNGVLGRVGDATVSRGAALGLVRGLGGGRHRETFILPLSAEGAEDVGVWRDLYECEPAWLDHALAMFGHPGLDALLRAEQ
jgi:hypothetical protein